MFKIKNSVVIGFLFFFGYAIYKLWPLIEQLSR
jgi:hypothetical protein